MRDFRKEVVYLIGIPRFSNNLETRLRASGFAVKRIPISEFVIIDANKIQKNIELDKDKYNLIHFVCYSHLSVGIRSWFGRRATTKYLPHIGRLILLECPIGAEVSEDKLIVFKNKPLNAIEKENFKQVEIMTIVSDYIGLSRFVLKLFKAMRLNSAFHSMCIDVLAECKSTISVSHRIAQMDGFDMTSNVDVVYEVDFFLKKMFTRRRA
jgi:hypothetical protein